MITFDLKTLPGWETLAQGKCILQIVARAENLIDSNKSDPIEFEGPPDYLCFTAEKAGSTVAMAVKGTPTKGQAFETSTDGTNWSVFTPGTTTITLANAGDKVYFRGDNTTVSESSSIYYNFVMSGKIAASGNIMSLLDKTCQSTTISNNYCYYNMFFGCTSLTTAPALPATTLAVYCYSYMFYGCTSLTTAPELPATTLANYCYHSMFSKCTSLTTAPELPATTLASNCYSSMFLNCISLTTGPSILPATTLARYCYLSMFYGCTSLTTAPELPATTLARDCYSSMFQGCTSLTTAPELPATTLAISCYNSMFLGCTSLTTAPALPATTLISGCYSYMFYGCTSLTTAPALPATTLASNCYQYMFYSCTSLTTAPALPATTLAASCYRNMFYGCTSLQVYSSSGTGHTKAWRIPTSGSASSYTSQSEMFYNCPGSYTSSSTVSLNTTFYTQNTPV